MKEPTEAQTGLDLCSSGGTWRAGGVRGGANTVLGRVVVPGGVGLGLA